eukprot:5113061-Pyramimonas_sp.AAC.1
MEWLGTFEWPWIIMADWNIEPNLLTSWASKADGVVVRPWQATCGNSEYDFAVVSTVLASRVGKVEVLSQAPMHPHLRMVMGLKGLRRRATITKASYPARFPLVLPPPTQPAPPELDSGDWAWELGGMVGDIQEASEFWLDM